MRRGVLAALVLSSLLLVPPHALSDDMDVKIYAEYDARPYMPKLYEPSFSSLYASLFGGMDSSQIKAELGKSEREYEKRFGQKADLYYIIGSYHPYYSLRDGLPDKDRILLLKYALKNNKPYPKKHSGFVKLKEERAFVREQEICTARYELFFNRKIPNVRYVDSLCDSDKHYSLVNCWFFNGSDCSCDGYLEHTLCTAKEPFPDSIVVAEFDIWIAVYQKYTRKMTFPVWFQNLSDENKLECLKARREGWGFMVPFISQEEEDSIKVELKKAVAKSEQELGRKMTEFEKMKAEFKIQCEGRVPEPEYLEEPDWLRYYTDKGRLTYLKYQIRANKCYWLRYDDLKRIPEACMQ